jgi:Lrp/AsnC family leucine-responsive transcriptional regulator
MNVLKIERERIIDKYVVLVNRSKVEKGFVVFVLN